MDENRAPVGRSGGCVLGRFALLWALAVSVLLIMVGQRAAHPPVRALELFFFDGAYVWTALALVMAAFGGPAGAWKQEVLSLGLLTLGLIASIYLPVGWLEAPWLWSRIAVGYLGLWGLTVAAYGLGRCAVAWAGRSWLGLVVALLLLILLASTWWIPVPGGAPAHFSPYEKHFFPAMRGVLRLSDSVYYLGLFYLASLGYWVRVRQPLLSFGVRWTAFGIASVGVMAFYGAAVQRDRLWRAPPPPLLPSAETLGDLARVSGPVEVLCFVRDSRGAAPAEQLQARDITAYAATLQAANHGLSLQWFDAFWVPDLARELRVPGNGHVILRNSQGDVQRVPLPQPLASRPSWSRFDRHMRRVFLAWSTLPSTASSDPVAGKASGGLGVGGGRSNGLGWLALWSVPLLVGGGAVVGVVLGWRRRARLNRSPFRGHA